MLQQIKSEQGEKCTMIGQPITSQDVNDDGYNHMNIDRTIGVNKTEELTFEEPVVLYVHGDDLDIQTDLEDELHTESANDIQEEFNVTKHISRKPFKCSQCTKKFATKTKLDYHLRTHEKSGLDNGLDDGGRKDRSRDMEETDAMIRILEDDNSFDEDSSEATNYSDTIVNNIDNVLQQGDDITHLEELRTHTEEKRFECSYCKKTYSRKQDMITHARIHTGEKLFECSFCKKKFSRKQHMISHSRTHTGEKPFECSYCKKKFAQQQQMTIHSRTHTGEKPFECSYCKKGFSRKQDMIIHISRMHTGEKPFECSYCKERFTLKHYMIRHSRTHTGEKLFKFNLTKRITRKPLKCSLCTKKFVTKTQLDYHLRTHEKPGLDNGLDDGGREDMHARIHTGEKLFECSY